MGGGRLEIVDREALVQWLATQKPEAGVYRTKIEPDMKGLQAHFKATGEIPPGMEHVDEHEVIKIEPANLDAGIARREEP